MGLGGLRNFFWEGKESDPQARGKPPFWLRGDSPFAQEARRRKMEAGLRGVSQLKKLIVEERGDAVEDPPGPNVDLAKPNQAAFKARKRAGQANLIALPKGTGAPPAVLRPRGLIGY